MLTMNIKDIRQADHQLRTCRCDVWNRCDRCKEAAKVKSEQKRLAAHAALTR